MKQVITLVIITTMFAFAKNLHAQNVGIGTNNPRSKLEVNGTCRIDTIKTSITSKKVLVQDSATGNIGYIPIDSFKSSSGSGTTLPTVYYAENDSVTSTTSGTPITRITLTLQPGTYLISGWTETYNDTYNGGSNSCLVDDLGHTIGHGTPWSTFHQWGTWCISKKITITVATTYYLQWYSYDPPSSTCFVRNARIVALRCQ